MAHSSFRDDYPRQDIHGDEMSSKVSAILESIKSVLPEGGASQRSAFEKMAAQPVVGGIFWKDKLDLNAFRACADATHTSRREEIRGELSTAEALNKRLEKLLVSSQTASTMKQHKDHHNGSFVRQLGFSSDPSNVRLGPGINRIKYSSIFW